MQCIRCWLAVIVLIGALGFGEASVFAQTKTVLSSFRGGSDGVDPAARLLQASQGNLPTLTGISLNANTTVAYTQNLIGTLTLNAPATTGMTILLTSSNKTVIVPNVNIRRGQSSATFNVYTSLVASSTTVTLTASYNGTSVNTSFTVTPLTVSSFSLSSTSVTGGQNTTGTITLNGTPRIAWTATLSSSNTAAATVPASVTIAANTSSVTFPVTTQTVTTTATSTLNATFLGHTYSAPLTVIPAPRALSVSPTEVAGGHSVICVLNLDYPAPSSGLVVTVTSNNTDAVPSPGTITVPPGQTSISFPITTQAVTSDANIAITAKSGSLTRSASFTVQAIRLTSLQFASSTIEGGLSTYLPLSFNGPAPTGTVVTLTSSNPAVLAVPSSVPLSGFYGITLLLDTALVTKPTTVTVTAVSGSVTLSTPLTITP